MKKILWQLALVRPDLHFIHQGNTVFTKTDYQEIAKADRIRNASDYDDFYIVNKEETKALLEFVKVFLEKTVHYINQTTRV